ncbi:MAG: flavodoxin family protein [Candidatus Helarchaeota archaeon]
MKILITYYTETGNTEKIAKSIEEGISGENPTIKKIDEIDATSLGEYDLIFLGSPTHGNSLPKATKKLLKACPEINGKFALFSTHQSSDKAFYSNFFKSATKILGKKNIVVVDQFDCLGENRNEQVTQMLRAAMPDKIDEMMKLAKDHPNEEDLSNAKKFGKQVLEKLSAKAEH